MLTKLDALRLTEAAIETENVALSDRYQKFATAVANVIEIKANLGLQTCQFTLLEKDYPTARCIADELRVGGYDVALTPAKKGYNLIVQW